MRISAVAPDAELSISRLTDRQSLLKELDSQRQRMDHGAEARRLDGYQKRAFSLLSSPNLSKAFDMASETAVVRDKYGRTQFGQCCLLGAPFGRSWRADDERPLLPHAVWFLGYARQALHANEAVTLSDLRPGVRGPCHGPERMRATRSDAGCSQCRVRTHAED